MRVLATLLALALLLSPALAHAAPPPTPPAPCIDESLTLTGSNLWRGLQNATVVLTMRDGETLKGTIVAQDHDRLALARAIDGELVGVPKREIVDVRLIATSSTPRADLPPVSNRPSDDGRKSYGAGVGMLTFGVPLGLSGTVMLGISPGALYINLPLLLPGIGLIIGGSVALSRSYAKHHAYRKAWGLPNTSKLQLAPTLNLGREGGQVGLVMRF